MTRLARALLELVGMLGGWTREFRDLHPSAYP